MVFRRDSCESDVCNSVMADVDQVCFWVCGLVLPSESGDVAFL